MKDKRVITIITVYKKCAWCGVALKSELWEKTSDYHFEGCVSHGICGACMQKEIETARAVKEKTHSGAPPLRIGTTAKFQRYAAY